MLNEDFIYLVLETVSEIPRGCVATYGQIAASINYPKHARLIGKVLSLSEFFGTYPCHRVVNYNGRLAPQFQNQKALLEAEGITFKDSLHVDLKKCLWHLEKEK